MKIAIIGNGTSAIITALISLQNGHQVEIFFDPNQSPINVGESTTVRIGKIISDSLGICIGSLYDNGIVSYKNGIKFIGWGDSKFFRHHFYTNESAFHFQSISFNRWIQIQLENFGVIYHPKKITQYALNTDKDCVIIDNKFYDFVINCGGWSNEVDYFNTNFETVNSSVLYKKDEIDDPTYTIHRATEDGWEFGLPFPAENITKHGYLFNNKFIDPKEVQKKLGKEDSRVIQWKPRYSKRLLTSKYEASNGNRLMFFEPLQALSLHYYAEFADNINLFLKERTFHNFNQQNFFYRKKIFEYEQSLAFHYSYGSKFKSNFWKDVQERSNKLLNTNNLMQKEFWNELSISNSFRIGIFTRPDFEQIHSGMTGISMNEVYGGVNVNGFL